LQKPKLAQHLEVEVGPLLEPLQLQELALLLEEVEALAKLGLDGLDRPENRLARRHVVALRVHREPRDALPEVPGERVEEREGLDLVVEERDPQRRLAQLRGEDVDRVAPDPEGPAPEVDVVARVLHPRQPAQEVALETGSRARRMRRISW